MAVPDGGLSPDGERWLACKPGFFLSVGVLSRLFPRRFLEELAKAHRTGRLHFFGEHAAPAGASAFADWLAALRESEWGVYAKRPFAVPASLEACPTPAPRTPSSHRGSATEVEHRTTLNTLRHFQQLNRNARKLSFKT